MEGADGGVADRWEQVEAAVGVDDESDLTELSHRLACGAIRGAGEPGDVANAERVRCQTEPVEAVDDGVTEQLQRPGDRRCELRFEDRQRRDDRRSSTPRVVGQLELDHAGRRQSPREEFDRQRQSSGPFQRTVHGGGWEGRPLSERVQHGVEELRRFGGDRRGCQRRACGDAGREGSQTPHRGRCLRSARGHEQPGTVGGARQSVEEVVDIGNVFDAIEDHQHPPTIERGARCVGWPHSRIEDVLASDGETGVIAAFESNVVVPGNEGIVTADVEPGRWVVVCPIPNAEGTAHTELGMVHEFAVV